jgi:hypothetical protein
MQALRFGIKNATGGVRSRSDDARGSSSADAKRLQDIFMETAAGDIEELQNEMDTTVQPEPSPDIADTGGTPQRSRRSLFQRAKEARSQHRSKSHQKKEQRAMLARLGPASAFEKQLLRLRIGVASEDGVFPDEDDSTPTPVLANKQKSRKSFFGSVRGAAESSAASNMQFDLAGDAIQLLSANPLLAMGGSAAFNTPQRSQPAAASLRPHAGTRQHQEALPVAPASSKSRKQFAADGSLRDPGLRLADLRAPSALTRRATRK